MLLTSYVTANRTFVRLGALTGACAALRVAAAVCVAGSFAWVRPAVWAGCARPGAGRGIAYYYAAVRYAPGRQFRASDPRE